MEYVYVVYYIANRNGRRTMISIHRTSESAVLRCERLRATDAGAPTHGILSVERKELSP